MNSPHDPHNGHPHDDQSHNADLTAFALDQLTGEKRDAMEQRLQEDETARQVVAETQQLGQLLRQSAGDNAIPPSLTLQTAVEQRLDQREPAEPADEKPVAAQKTPDASRRVASHPAGRGDSCGQSACGPGAAD